MKKKRGYAKKLSLAITSLEKCFQTVLKDNDVAFERELIDYSESTSKLSNKNLSKIELMLKTIKGLCDFFYDRPESFTMEIFDELQEDLIYISKEITAVSDELASLDVVRTKVATGIFAALNEAMKEIRFICHILVTVSCGNFEMIKFVEDPDGRVSLAM